MGDGLHAARLYDGRSAVARDVTIRLLATSLEIRDHEGRPVGCWPYAGVSAAGSLGDDAAVTLSSSAAPDARLRLADAAAVSAVLARLPRTARTDRFQAKRVAGWTALGLAALALAVLAVDRLPQLAAPLLPHDAKVALGEAVMHSMFPPEAACTGPGVAPLTQLSEQLRRAAGIEHKLEVFMVDDSMVNAFAAPGGVVVVTRGLIDAADDPDEVAGVLAHEIGHVRHDHATQGVLRSIGISALLQLLTGGSDLEGLANAGGMLAWLSYSRAAEEQADTTALDILATAGINGDGLSRFFARLEQEEAESGIAGLIPTWLSTHPPTDARRAATERERAGRPALTAEAWTALRGACG